MKYSIFINQTKVIEWGLNTSEAILVDLFSHLPKWADEYKIINDEIWYFFGKPTIVQEVPMLGDKVDTIYRLCKKLEGKGLIFCKKIGKRDFWRISQKLKEWDFVENSEKFPSSEKNPTETRKKIRDNSENFPTDHNTILSNNNIISSLRSEIICDEPKNSFLENFSENSKNPTELETPASKSSAADSTKPKIGQTLEAEKFVHKTSGVSNKQAEENEARVKMLQFLKQSVGCDKFKDCNEWTEIGKILRIAEKLGKNQFLYRLEKILEDPFKAKNSNKLSYLRKEIEAFIHSPAITSNSEKSGIIL